MHLCFIYTIILFHNINYIISTFKIDFSFLLPDYNTTNLISPQEKSETANSENSPNISIKKDIYYYYYLKPMTNLCIGDPSQCFQIPISFNYYETILNLNILNFKYTDSSSFSLTSKISTLFSGSDIFKIGKSAKNLISKYDFIITNETFGTNISILGLGRYKFFTNFSLEKNISFNLKKQLKDKKMIESNEITIKYTNDFSGKITLGTNYTGMKIDKSLFLELPNNENSLNGFLESIYIEDTTISSTKNQHIDLLEKDKRKKIFLDFESTFIIFGEEIFEKLKMISLNSYINAGICDLRKEDNLKIQYLVCKDDILNSNLDELFFVINHRKNIAVKLNDLFLPFPENNKKNIIFGIISSQNNNDTINIGTVLLKKYMTCLNREKNIVRLYLKNISGEIPTDFFGIGGIITLSVIICSLIIYMVSTICGKEKHEPNYSPKTQKFLNRKNLDTSMQSNESL